VDGLQERFGGGFDWQGFMRLWKRVSLLGIEAGNESDDLARQRYGYGDAMEGARLTAMGRPPMVTGLESIKAEAAAGHQGGRRLWGLERRVASCPCLRGGSWGKSLLVACIESGPPY
jgi:hypothetical protein